MTKRFIAFAILLILFFPPEQAVSSIRPEEVLVVVNTNEPLSAKVADYYASKRRIPAQNILRLACTREERVTPAEFVASIQGPIEDYLYTKFGSDPAKPGDDSIKVILLTYGIPSRIDQGERLSSVDSTLALLFNQTPWGRLPIARYCDPRMAIPNVYYGQMKTFAEVRADTDLNDVKEPPPPYSVVRMLDANTAVAGGPGGLLARGQRSDGNWNWEPLPDDRKGFIAYRVSEIFALDATRVWVCTGEEDGQGGSVIYSDDGGRNWRLVKTARSGGPGFVLPDAFHGVAFADENTGWVVGRWQTRAGSGSRIERTTDGGRSWTEFSDKFDNRFVPRGVSSPDKSNVWVCGSGGIFHSSDAGARWSRLSTDNLYKIHVRRSGNGFEGWAVGARGKILHSTDGKTWKDVRIEGVNDDLKDLAVLGGKMAVALGRGRLLFYDGREWSIDESDFGAPKLSVAASDKTNVLAATGATIIRWKGADGWRNSEGLRQANWRLRYLICRLDGMSGPITNSYGIPDDIKSMIDNSVSAKPGGVFLLEEPYRADQRYGTENYAEAEKLLREHGRNVNRDASSKVFQEEPDVIGYASFGMHDHDIRSKLIWGQPLHKWRPGAVAVIMESTDGRSLRTAHYSWGIGSGTERPGAQVVVTDLPYSGYWIAIHDANGNILARATASDGRAAIDLAEGSIKWPADGKTSLQVHFPEDDPLHPGETLEHARYPWSIGSVDTRLRDLAQSGRGIEFKFSGVRNLAASLMRSGASGATANVDEPFMILSADANQILPAYGSGFTWAESAWMGFRGLGWKGVVIGDPLMAPFAD